MRKTLKEKYAKNEHSMNAYILLYTHLKEARHMQVSRHFVSNGFPLTNYLFPLENSALTIFAKEVPLIPIKNIWKDIS